MPVQIQLTYEMAKALGAERFEVDATSVAEAVGAAKRHLLAAGVEFDGLSRRTAVAVNGVLVRHRDRLGTRLADGDTLAFVKAAAGG